MVRVTIATKGLKCHVRWLMWQLPLRLTLHVVKARLAWQRFVSKDTKFWNRTDVRSPFTDLFSSSAMKASASTPNAGTQHMMIAHTHFGTRKNPMALLSKLTKRKVSCFRPFLITLLENSIFLWIGGHGVVPDIQFLFTLEKRLLKFFAFFTCYLRWH